MACRCAAAGVQKPSMQRASAWHSKGIGSPVSGSSLARNMTRCGAGKNSSRAVADGNSSTGHGLGSLAAAASEKTPVDRYLQQQ